MGDVYVCVCVFTEQCEDDVLSQCQLFIQLMKLFPGTVLEFGVSFVALIQAGHVLEGIIYNKVIYILQLISMCRYAPP